MEKLDWIKKLVLAERQMEDTGMVGSDEGLDPDRQIEESTVEFLTELKLAFIESATAFNQLKGSALGNIKIYGISKTRTDFMLFRNGYKLVFSMRQAGLITISYFNASVNYAPAGGPGEPLPQDMLVANWGAFGQLIWTYNEQPIALDYLVRYYMSRFAKDSSK